MIAHRDQLRAGAVGTLIPRLWDPSGLEGFRAGSAGIANQWHDSQRKDATRRTASVECMTASDDEREQHLIASARGGDLDAFNQIVDQYQAMIYRVCLRILRDAGRAEDATQDTFIKAYSSLDQYKGGSFKSWLARIATNRCYDVLRSERRRPADSLDSEPVESEPTWSIEPAAEDPDSYAGRSQLSAYLERALGELPDDQRTAIILADIHGYRYEEIAETVGASIGTVKSRISRARSRLRDVLRADHEARELFGSVLRHSEKEASSAQQHRSERESLGPPDGRE